MRSLFPLLLAPFEEYILADDRPGYRMTFFFELTFAGELDRPAFEVGLNEALRRHPLLSSLVQRAGWRRLAWVAAENIAPVINWGPADSPIQFPEDDGIDLSRETGLRFFIRVGAGETRMVVQFHHACCDGYGAIQFLSDVFAGYVRRLNSAAVEVPDYQPTVPERLARRDDLHVCIWDPARRWRFVWESACQLLREALRPVAALAPPVRGNAAVSDRLDSPGNLTRTLEKRVFHGLKVLARRHGVTVNDLLLSQLFLTLRDWNQPRQSSSARLPLGVLVPTSLRSERHDGMPAANVMSFHFCRRRVEDCADSVELLKSLHAEQLYVKRWRFSALFLNAIRALRRVPGLLPFTFSRIGCRATAVLSCVGDPSRVITAQYPVNAEGNPVLGNLVLTDVSAAPPIRSQTSASFTAWQFDEKLRLGVRCDPQIFSRTAADELLDLFCSRVNALGASVESKAAARIAA